MKNIYAAAYAATILVLLYCVVCAASNKKKIASTVQKLLVAATVAVVASMAILPSKKETVSLIAYSVYFASIDWLLYYLLQFSVEYTGLNLKEKIHNMRIALILGIDTVSMLLNIRFLHAFRLRLIRIGGTEPYYLFEAGAFYLIHLVLSYILTLFILMCLAYKIYRSPALYRKKYLLVLFVFVLLVVLDACFVFLNHGIDTAILFYALAGISIYYFALIYAPKELLNSTFSEVVHNMTDALILFDLEDNCIYANQKAETYFDIHTGETLVPKNRFLELFLQLKNNSQGESRLDETIVSEGREYHVRLQYHRMEDKKGCYIGGFFIVANRTDEVNKIRGELYRTSHDNLTGLYNKEYFYQQSSKQIRRHPNVQYLMVCTDIPSFKLFHDLFGRRRCDELLIRISNRLRGQTGAGTVYGHIEGGKFAVLIQKDLFQEELFINLLEGGGDCGKSGNCPLDVTVGVYEIDSPFIPVSVMLERAMIALGTVQGKKPDAGFGGAEAGSSSGVAWYTEQLHQTVLRERDLQEEMEGALLNGQFCIYLQPQFSAERKLLGAEALARWEHPKKGLILPNEFIPIFEKNGLIAELDRYVWELSFEKIAEWKKRNGEKLYISVNISPKDFYFMDVYRVFSDLAAKYAISPHHIKIEVTEDVLTGDDGRRLAVVGRLRSAGFLIEMHNPGKAYDLLLTSEKVCMDALKYNMFFLKDRQTGEHTEQIVRAMIALAAPLGMTVAASGVEDEEQYLFLREAGCEIFQGYYFAKPMEVTEFEERFM